MENVTLGRGTRAIIGSLNDANTLIARTQERLATGLKVNGAIDDALAFFKARSLNSRAADLSTIKDAMHGGLGVIRTALHGLETMESVLKQMKSLAQAAIAAPESVTRAVLASQFNELRSQIDNVAEDSGFNGQNLLKNASTPFKGGADEVVVKFNERVDRHAANEFVVSGLKAADFATIIAKPAVPRGQIGADTVWGQTGAAAAAAIGQAIEAIDSALATVRQAAQEFGTKSAMLSNRVDFTNSLISGLEEGASVLVNADLNEESANLLSLETRQQLGVVALGLRGSGASDILERLL